MKKSPKIRFFELFFAFLWILPNYAPLCALCAHNYARLRAGPRPRVQESEDCVGEETEFTETPDSSPTLRHESDSEYPTPTAHSPEAQTELIQLNMGLMGSLGLDLKLEYSRPFLSRQKPPGSRDTSGEGNVCQHHIRLPISLPNAQRL
jgi:hypothetical protein